MMLQAIQQSGEIYPATILIWVTETILVGLIGSHVTLWMSHMKHKQHVAEHYVSKPDNVRVEESIVDMQKTLRDILAIVHELKGRSQGARNE